MLDQLKRWALRLAATLLFSALAQGILLALKLVGVDIPAFVAGALGHVGDAQVMAAVTWIAISIAGLAFLIFAPPIDEMRRHAAQLFGGAPANRPALPDWALSDVFHFLDPRVLEDDGRRPTRWENVGRRLRDALVNGLNAWGREGEGANAGPLAPIPAHYWNKADFTYNFFAPNGNARVATIPPAGELAYSDVQLNRQQAAAYFPAPGMDDAAGRWQGQRFVYAKPRQVFTRELLYDDDDLNSYFRVSDIDPQARVRYSIESAPDNDWTFRLGIDDAAATSGAATTEAALDEAGGIRLFVSPGTRPAGLSVRVFIHSWTRAES